ncbi:MAG: hypothetical protein ACREUF_18030, partial [Solimonas sp.]
MSRKILIPLLLALTATALPVETSRADPPDWAPAHGDRAKHRYVYYPVREVYYEPASNLWFWLDSGRWSVGLELPIYYRQYTRGGVTIELDGDRPYYRHDYVVEHYGRGPRVVERHSY